MIFWCAVIYKMLKREVNDMVFLRWLGGIVVFIWLLGLLLKIGGAFIHILLVIAAVVFIIDFITGRRTK